MGREGDIRFIVSILASLKTKNYLPPELPAIRNMALSPQADLAIQASDSIKFRTFACRSPEVYRDDVSGAKNL